jgi:hypothetical protein
MTHLNNRSDHQVSFKEEGFFLINLLTFFLAYRCQWWLLNLKLTDCGYS